MNKSRLLRPFSAQEIGYSVFAVSGAGKTTTLREVQRGLKEAGHAVFAITPNASAARVLRDEGFPRRRPLRIFCAMGRIVAGCGRRS